MNALRHARFAALLLLLTGANVQGQQPVSLEPGDRVVITTKTVRRAVNGASLTDRSSSSGRVRSVGADVLVLRLDDGSEQRLSISALRAGEASIRRRLADGNDNSLLYGLLGAAAGGGLGWMLSSGIEEPEPEPKGLFCFWDCGPPPSRDEQRFAVTVGSAALGGSLGYLLGKRMAQRWETIHLERLGTSVGPEGRVAVNASFRTGF
jgi:hypothetical protein